MTTEQQAAPPAASAAGGAAGRKPGRWKTAARLLFRQNLFGCCLLLATAGVLAAVNFLAPTITRPTRPGSSSDDVYASLCQRESYDYGFPSTGIVRRATSPNFVVQYPAMPAQPPRVWNKEYWLRDTEIVQISALGLAVDTIFGVGLLAAVAIGWSLLGSQRLRFWQFTLRQALVLMLVVFCVAGYFGAVAEGARRDRAVTRQLQETIQSAGKPWRVQTSSGWGGPAWVKNVFDYGFLRRRLGIFMRTSSLWIGGEDFGDDDLLALEPLLEQLPHLRSISTTSVVTPTGSAAMEESLSCQVDVLLSAPR